MLKFLIISFLVFFIVIKLVGFFFRLLLKSSVNYQQQQHYQQRQQEYNSGRKPSDGNVNIDYVPDGKKEKRKDKPYNGGEYIDYEEVK